MSAHAFFPWINNPGFSVSNSLADVCFTASFKRNGSEWLIGRGLLEPGAIQQSLTRPAQLLPSTQGWDGNSLLISPSGHPSCPSTVGTASLRPLIASESFGLEGFPCLPQAVPAKEGEEIWWWGVGYHHSFNSPEEQHLTDTLLSLKHFFHLKVTTPWL